MALLLTATWKRLGAVLGSSWGRLGAVLEPSWGHFGAILRTPGGPEALILLCFFAAFALYRRSCCDLLLLFGDLDLSCAILGHLGAAVGHLGAGLGLLGRARGASEVLWRLLLKGEFCFGSNFVSPLVQHAPRMPKSIKFLSILDEAEVDKTL